MKVIALLLSIILLSLSVQATSISFPFKVDVGGRSPGLTTVGINISTGSNCVSPFYFNKTTTAYGTGQINVTSNLFVEGRTYVLCFNATSSSRKIFGRTTFQSPLGSLNETSKVIINNTNRGKIYINNTIFFNDTLNSKIFKLTNGSLFDNIYGRFNNTWAGHNLILNNTNQGKIYLNDTLYIDKHNVTGLMSLYLGDIRTAIFYSPDSIIRTRWLNMSGTLYGFGSSADAASAQVNFIARGSTSGRFVFINTKSNGAETLAITNTVSTSKTSITCNNCNYVRIGDYLVPVIDNFYDLGNATLRWRNFYAYNQSISGLSNLTNVSINNRRTAWLGQYKIFLNKSTTSNTSITAKNYLLNNGSNFDNIYGRFNNNQTLANGLVKNNTAQGKVYLNSTLFVPKLNVTEITYYSPSGVSGRIGTETRPFTSIFSTIFYFTNKLCYGTTCGSGGQISDNGTHMIFSR